MFDKLEKHNNKKFTYVFNRRMNAIKNAVLSFFSSEKDDNSSIYSSNYLLSTRK